MIFIRLGRQYNLCSQLDRIKKILVILMTLIILKQNIIKIYIIKIYISQCNIMNNIACNIYNVALSNISCHIIYKCNNI